MTETYFHDETPLAVRDALERARLTGTRVRVFYGDTETGQAWLEESDVSGRIGRSTGTKPIPLIISRRNCFGGPAVLDRCIVAIKSTSGWLYRNPQFSVGTFTIHCDETPVRVSHNGKTWARFSNLAKAKRRVAFMHGERLGK